MRVLGRVTGTGNFMPDLSLGNDDEDEKIQNETKRNQREKKQSDLLAHDFPALSLTTNTNTTSATSGETTSMESAPKAQHHPLSVVPSLVEKEKLNKQKAAELEANRVREREIAVRKVQRNMV